MGWTIAEVGWRRATGGVALALAALAGSHDSVRAQTVADSAGTTLSSPYSLTLAAVDGFAAWTRTAAGDVRKDPGEALDITPSRNTVTITGNTDVCDRTEQVRDAIVAAVGVTDCADVTDAHLAAITKLNLRSGSIMALAAGDLAGLTSLESLYLNDNRLTSLPDSIFAGLTSLEWLDLDDNQLTSLPDGVFAGLTSLWLLALHDNRLTTLPDGVFAGLTSLRLLTLSNNELTSMPADVFAGLTSLEQLGLYYNQLTTLPAGVFAGLTSLRRLTLSDNQLTSLPAGVFAGLASLEYLYLHGNRLTSLPAGIFAGLTSLETLNLSWNATDPLPLAVTLEKVGESRFKAVAPTGAPFEFVLPVSAANGSIEGDSTAIRIPAGAVESGPLDITRAADTTAAVTVDIDSLPGLPSGHSGYALEKDSSLPQAILLSASTGMTLSVSPDQVGEEAGATTLTVTATLNGIALKADTAVALTVHALTAGHDRLHGRRR
ncbi:leucine-rich repeat domain-containing protein [Candidatus Palauibacter sp.]|uniref:leucine-rich repeat domain-containing protein n=1 Tax=Candidatus Palauibacter sp. TaxID=3101350 RepID=UPI003AF30F40